MHQDLYKQNINKNERQELRRQKLLQEQKIKRLEHQDEQRQLSEINKEFVDKTRYRRHTFQDLYGDDLSIQLSEWLREKPDDLEEWLLRPCPMGQRCLVVSGRGRTKMFSKAGRFRMSFKSLLPGGGATAGEGGKGGGFSILDCVYNVENDCFYVLDVLWYGKQCFLDCETQFRFFWLKSKFEEIEDDQEFCNKDSFKTFRLLKSYDMSNEEMTARALQTYPLWNENQPELDGFLFYHKESSYTCGPTPLVCWLFPFMVEEVLQMGVNSQYERPPNYSNPWLYMEEFDKELARKRQKRQRKQMDYTNDTDSSSCSLSQSKGMGGFEENIEENEKETEEPMMGDNETDSLKHIMKAECLLELEGIAEM